MKQKWWMVMSLINGSLVQHRIDKSKNRLLSVQDLERRSKKYKTR